MEPTTDAQIAETLQWMRQTMESGTDFVRDQAPMWANELLAYGALTAWLDIGFAILVFIAAAMMLYYAFKEHDFDLIDNPIPIISGAAGFIALAIALGITHDAALQLVSIHSAPRVYILEHLPNLN